jgi:hypothetical protein
MGGLNSSGSILDSAASGAGYIAGFLAAIITGTAFCCCASIFTILWCSIKDLAPKAIESKDGIELNDSALNSQANLNDNEGNAT